MNLKNRKTFSNVLMAFALVSLVIGILVVVIALFLLAIKVFGSTHIFRLCPIGLSKYCMNLTWWCAGMVGLASLSISFISSSVGSKIWWDDTTRVNSPVFPTETSLLSIQELIPEGFRVGIEILNDETTPMLLVIDMFKQILRKSEKESFDLMLKIHTQGGVLISCASIEDAEKISNELVHAALDKGYLFTCRTART